MATTTRRTILVGVFDDSVHAQHAVGALRKIGLGASQIGFAVRHGELTEANGALDAIAVPEHDLTGGLIALGVPVAHARAFGSDFERCRTIVTAQPNGGPRSAAAVLHRNGALSVLTWSPEVPSARVSR